MAPRKLSRWPFVAVVACLFLSGAASLVLELVWSRLLKLVFGSTTLAVSTILIAYMLGLGLGGLLGGRVAHRLRNGVRAYGLFEVGLGAYALAVPFLLQQFPAIDRAGLTGLGFWPAALVRFVLALLLLLLPTILMGATLPVLVAALARGGSGLGSRAGLLYGINTMGAVGGTLLATFVLFPRVGLAATNLAGAILDLLAGLVALAWLARSFQAAGRPSASAKQARVVRAARPGRWNLLLVSYALVGFTALVYEIGWTRVLAMVLGSSIYAFATMLVAFLAGIALGSLLFRRRADRLARPLAAYALGVALLGGVAFAAGLVFGNLPDLFLALMAWTGPGRVFQVLVQLGVAGVVMLAPTLVLGALFPLVARAAGAGRTDGGRVVGDVYFANTMGSAAGAFAAGFVLIPLAGLRVALAGAVGLNLATAAILLARQRQWTGSGKRLAAGLLGVSAVAMVLFPPAWNERSLTRGLYYHPSKMMTFSLPLHRYEGMPDPEEEEILFYRDGLNTTVSVHRDLAGLDLLLNGKADASLGDMSTQVLSGQIPMLFGGPVERALVIGYASGVTTGAVALHEPERVDVVDIEPAVFQASHFFDDFNHHPLDDPRVHVVIDDGRTYLAATGARYDVIVSEPSNPWIAGCSNLFTREFFQIARQALRPGGRLLQWIPIYDMDRTVLQAILRGLQAEFPYVYGFLESVDEVDLLILATDRELSLADLPDWPGLPEAVRDDLRRIGIFSSAQLWSLMRLTAEDIGKMTRGAGPVNSDDNMYVELHLPWTRNRFPLREWDVLGRFTEGAGGMDGPGSPPLTPDELGALALSYLEERHDPRVAETLLRRARPGEECALCLTAVAALAGQMAGAP
ncbi:MAG: fused MFS/spermidine synthase, partial [Acidobacteriota bacterium]